MQKYFELLTRGTDFKIEKFSTCKYCGAEFPLFDTEKKFLDKYGFKYPEHCNTCNFRLLNTYLNNRHLYYRTDSKTGKRLISILPDVYSGEVMEANAYKKFKLDDGGLQYGKDLGDDIFGDFYSLVKSFPKPSRLIYPDLENAEYASHVGSAKNIYMSYCVFTDCENIYYSLRVMGGCHNVFSSHNIVGSSNIYYSTNVGQSHNICNSDTIVDSSDLYYSSDMNNCKHCFFSCNQVNKSFMLFNKQYSKEEYEVIKEDILSRLNDKKQHDFLIKEYENFLQQNLIKEATDTNRCENVSGENIFGAKDVINSFSASGLDTCVSVLNMGDGLEDHMVNIYNSIEAGNNVENIVGTCSFGTNVYNIFFSFGIVSDSKNIYYCYDMESCEECMFCAGLKSKKYHILNKAYSKDDYFFIKEHLIEKLKVEGKWGESLSFGLLPFAYNDTLAYDYFKVNKVIYADGRVETIDEDAIGTVKVLGNDFVSDAILDLGGEEKLKINWRTKNKEINIPENAVTIEAKDLPSIDQVDDSILEKVIICEEIGRPYRIMKAELDFLKKKRLPLPTVHNELRIDKLLSNRPVGELSIGTCDKCSKETLSAYKTKQKFKVYCSECYKGYMYG